MNMGPIEFENVDIQVWKMRLGLYELEIKFEGTPSDVCISSLTGYGFTNEEQIIIPCEQVSCPDLKDPDDLDECLQTCPFKYTMEECVSNDMRWGAPVRELAVSFRRQMVSQNEGRYRKSDWLPYAMMFAQRDWVLLSKSNREPVMILKAEDIADAAIEN